MTRIRSLSELEMKAFDVGRPCMVVNPEKLIETYAVEGHTAIV